MREAEVIELLGESRSWSSLRSVRRTSRTLSESYSAASDLIPELLNWEAEFMGFSIDTSSAISEALMEVLVSPSISSAKIGK